MRVVAVAVVLAVAGCYGDNSPAPAAAKDAGASAARDAAIDAAATPSADGAVTPDAAPPVTGTIAIARTTIVATDLQPPVAVTVTGPPGAWAVIAVDRGSAGTVVRDTILLDGAGAGSAEYFPCSRTVPGCVGAATLELSFATAPTVVVATAPFELVAPAQVGDVGPCLTGGNVMYLQGDDFIFNGTLQTDPSLAWTATPTVDTVEFDVEGGYRGTFSTSGLGEPLALGVYNDATRADFEVPGTPGLEVESPGRGCNQISGAFEVDDYTTDPSTGAVVSATFGFEQICDGSGELVGCFHYEAAPTPPPASPPPPDPTKVSVQVFAGGVPDTTADAIFTDAAGNVVLDTPVDAFGEAAAALPTGGELTVIQHAAGNYEYLTTYRDVVTGDHVVVGGTSPHAGASDAMHATFAPPAGSTTAALITACGGGGWAKSSQPVGADLTFFDGCRTPTFDMLSIASPSREFVWQTGLTHVPNGNVAIPDAWAPMGSASIALQNLPATGPALSLSWFLQVGAGGTQLLLTQAIPAGSDQIVSLAYPPGAGDGAVVTTNAVTYGLTGESRQVAVSGAPSAVALDFASLPVPLASAVAQDPDGVSWTETAGGADIRTVVWRGVMSNGHRTTWTIYEPYDGTASSSLPGLPAAHAADDPTQLATTLDGASVSYVDYDVLAGFAVTGPTHDYRMHAAFAETNDMRFPL